MSQYVKLENDGFNTHTGQVDSLSPPVRDNSVWDNIRLDYYSWMEDMSVRMSV